MICLVAMSSTKRRIQSRSASTVGRVAARCGRRLDGVRVLITGVSAGLGVEMARALVAHGAHVVGAARDLGKAERAIGVVRDAARSGGGAFDLVALDLADLKSVLGCADGLNEKADPFDLVIVNARRDGDVVGRTADGFETQFGTNHLGHFVPVNRVAPLLRDDGRLVDLSSAGHRFSYVDLDDPDFVKGSYDPWIGYGRSKTANILFAVAFDRRHKDRGVYATAVHRPALPG